MKIDLALLFFLSQFFPAALPTAPLGPPKPQRQQSRRRHKQNQRARKGTNAK